MVVANEHLGTLTDPHQHMDYDTCPICGDVSVCYNFGALCCRACAAFFRRTVASRKDYVCRKGKQCFTNKSQKKLTCQYCRFVACLREGMRMEGVQAFNTPITEEGSSMLSNATKAWRWSFLLRISALSEVHGGQARAMSVVNSLRTGHTFAKAYLAEANVLLHFLQCIRLSERLNGVSEMDLARALLSRWAAFENMWQIVRNKGFRTKMAHTLDGSVVSIDEQSLTAYYRTFNALRGEPDLLARSAFKYFTECVFRYAQLLHDAKLDETELVAFLMLHLLRFAAKKFDVQELARALANEVIRGLSEHYQTTYDDVPLRMAAVVLLLDESENCCRQSEEQSVMLRLMGQGSVADFFEPMAPASHAYSGDQDCRKYYFGVICLDDY